MPKPSPWIDLRGFLRIREDKLLAGLVSGAIFLASIVPRMELEALHPAIAPLVFMPAIALIALAAGWPAAALGTGLSAITFWWLPLPPAAPPPPGLIEWVAPLVFVASGIVMVTIVEGLVRLAWSGASAKEPDDVDGAARAQTGALLSIVEAILLAPEGDFEARLGVDAAAAAHARIGMLRIVADRLHRSDSGGGNWSRALRAICDDILRAHGTPDVAVRIEASDVGISQDRLAILSTIVAECLTHTAQAAAATGPARRFAVILRDLGAQRRVLEINPGIAAPRERDAAIARALAQLLDATLTVSDEPIVTVRVIFAR